MATVAAPARAGTAAACVGVAVVVDFGPLGGTRTGCAGGDPASGTAALRAAGFTVTPVQTQPGFVCRVDGLPASDPCVRTPPSNAYWSYWHALPGGSWTYSAQGGGSRDPAPGTVDGWSFGAGSPPGIAPPAASASPPPAPPPPNPQPTAPPVEQPRATGATPPPAGPAPPGSSVGASASAAVSASAATSAATSAPGTAGASASPGSSVSSSAAAPPAAGGAADRGDPWPLVAGGLAIAVIGAGAFAVARRRRAPGEE